MPAVITSISSSADEREAWKLAAKTSGTPVSVWARMALNAAVEATMAEDDASLLPPEMVRQAFAKPVARPDPRELMRDGIIPNATLTEAPAYTPPVLPPLPLGATTAPEVVDMDRSRQRGAVAAFIRSEGKDWRGQGPDPLSPGCQIRRDVMAEYEVHLRNLALSIDYRNQEAASMRAAGVPV